MPSPSLPSLDAAREAEDWEQQAGIASMVNKTDRAGCILAKFGTPPKPSPTSQDLPTYPKQQQDSICSSTGSDRQPARSTEVLSPMTLPGASLRSM